MKSKKGKMVLLILIPVVALFIICLYIKSSNVIIGSTYNTDDINSKELLLVYRFRSFAWGFSDYVFLINADGTVKYVDIATKLGKNFSLDTKESFSTLNALAVNVDIPITYSTDKITDSNVNKIINIQNVKLKRNREVANDAGYIGYYCIAGTKDKRKMVCIKEDGEFPRVCPDRNIDKVCTLIDDIVTDARTKN